MNIEQISMGLPMVISIIVWIIATMGAFIITIVKFSNRFTIVEKSVEDLKEVAGCRPEQLTDFNSRILVLENKQHQMDINYTEMKTAFDYTSQLIKHLDTNVSSQLLALKDEQNKLSKLLTEWIIRQEFKGEKK